MCVYVCVCVGVCLCCSPQDVVWEDILTEDYLNDKCKVDKIWTCIHAHIVK